MEHVVLTNYVIIICMFYLCFASSVIAYELYKLHK
jgi:hypothetical protein